VTPAVIGAAAAAAVHRHTTASAAVWHIVCCGLLLLGQRDWAAATVAAQLYQQHIISRSRTVQRLQPLLVGERWWEGAAAAAASMPPYAAAAVQLQLLPAVDRCSWIFCIWCWWCWQQLSPGWQADGAQQLSAQQRGGTAGSGRTAGHVNKHGAANRL
jgi:hypothetical protein